MIYIIDTFSWIDYFEGNLAGEKVREILENPKSQIITNVLSLAEISSVLKRKGIGMERIDEIFSIIFSFSRIFDINFEISMEGGFLHAEIKSKIKDFGLIDSFILLSAKKLNAKIVTGDKHFKGMKDVVFID